MRRISKPVTMGQIAFANLVKRATGLVITIANTLEKSDGDVPRAVNLSEEAFFWCA
jgi:hypothetical protein